MTMAHEPMSDARLAAIQAELDNCDADDLLEGYLHNAYIRDVPDLLTEVKRLRASAQQLQNQQQADHLRMNMAGISTAKPWPPVGGYYLPDPLPPVRRRGPFTEKTGRIPPTQD